MTDMKRVPSVDVPEGKLVKKVSGCRRQSLIKTCSVLQLARFTLSTLSTLSTLVEQFLSFLSWGLAGTAQVVQNFQFYSLHHFYLFISSFWSRRLTISVISFLRLAFRKEKKMSWFCSKSQILFVQPSIYSLTHNISYINIL